MAKLLIKGCRAEVRSNAGTALVGIDVGIVVVSVFVLVVKLTSMLNVGVIDDGNFTVGIIHLGVSVFIFTSGVIFIVDVDDDENAFVIVVMGLLMVVAI